MTHYNVLTESFQTLDDAKKWAKSCCKNLVKMGKAVNAIQWHKTGKWYIVVSLIDEDYTIAKYLPDAKRMTVIPPMTQFEWLRSARPHTNSPDNLYIDDPLDNRHCLAEFIRGF